MFKRITVVIASLLAFVATAFAQENSSPEYRLPDFIYPTQQKIRLNIDPDSPRFSGETTIDLHVTKATDRIGFYQLELNVKQAKLNGEAGSQTLQVSSGEYDIDWAVAEQDIKPGRYQLKLTYEGPINKTSDGLYLSHYEDRNYIFTQFEDMHARRAFPSFDEPDFKIPYQVTISSPEKHTVLSNTPVESRVIENGWQVVKFKKTKPMPTYILAMAVGEFDSIDIPDLSVPGKIYAPKGEAEKTRFVAQHTGKILRELESYFGIPYPYKKLDFIAVPNFTHGAMENAGLITYRSSLLILDDQPDAQERTRPLEVVTHELAHQWYGNLVTMAWWDDLWLNEAFASWMATKVMVSLYPELNLQAGLSQESAFGADANPSVRPIKKTVRIAPDVMDGLGLNYSKGEAILVMVESLIGEKAFQQGVRKYMETNKWSNATADDLWAALGDSGDIDLPAIMKGFITQPGYPLVTFDEQGQLQQSRYSLGGAEVEDFVWSLPLRIKYKKNDEIHFLTTLIDSKSATLDQLKGAQWVMPYVNALGYYRWSVPNQHIEAMLKDTDQLSSREKKALIYNSKALVTADKMPLATLFSVLGALANDEDPVVVRAVFSAMGSFSYLIDDSNEQLANQFIEQATSPWVDKLGIQASANDTRDQLSLRQSVLGLASRYSDDPSLLNKAQPLADRLLKRPQDSNLALDGIALGIVAKQAEDSAVMFNQLKQAFEANSDARIQGAIGSAMRFEDPQGQKLVLDFSLTDSVNPGDTIRMLGRGISYMDEKDLFYSWLDDHIEELKAKMPAYHLARMPEYLGRSCDAHNLALAEQFFAQHADDINGMPRSLEVMIQSTKQCIALKAQNQPAFTEFLQKLN